MSQSGDMLGYYYERADYTEQQFGSSNFETYNVAPDLPADNVTASLAGAQAIGFTTTPQLVHAPFNADIEDRPGLQWYPDRLESANPTINILGVHREVPGRNDSRPRSTSSGTSMTARRIRP